MIEWSAYIRQTWVANIRRSENGGGKKESDWEQAQVVKLVQTRNPSCIITGCSLDMPF